MIASNFVLGIMASNPWDDNDDIGTPVAVSMALAKVLSSAIMMWFFILVCTTVVLFEFELKTRLEKMVEMVVMVVMEKMVKMENVVNLKRNVNQLK